MAPAVEAYNEGHFADAERSAIWLRSSSVEGREKARAQWVLAFSAARRGDYSLARERFAVLKHDAATRF